MRATDLSVAEIERALTIARGLAADRAAFHAPYLIQLKKPFVPAIEIVTEFRRVVMIADDHILRGDRMFAFSARLAQDAVAPWKDRVSVIARLQFHPLNTYINVPPIAMTLDGPSGAAALVGILTDAVPSRAHVFPGEGQPILGAVAEAVFDATLVGRSTRTVTITLEGREVASAPVNFAALR